MIATCEKHGPYNVVIGAGCPLCDQNRKLGGGSRKAVDSEIASMVARKELRDEEDRIIACVNAMKNVPDPEAFMKAADQLAHSAFCSDHEDEPGSKCGTCYMITEYHKARGTSE